MNLDISYSQCEKWFGSQSPKIIRLELENCWFWAQASTPSQEVGWKLLVNDFETTQVESCWISICFAKYFYKDTKRRATIFRILKVLKILPFKYFFANQISKIIVFPYNLALAGRNRNYVFWEILATKNDSKLNKNQEGLNWRVYSYMNYLKTHIINAYTQSYQCKRASWTHLRMKDYTCKVMIVWWNTWRYVDNHVSACAMEVCKSWRGYSFTNQTMYWLQPRIKQF